MTPKRWFQNGNQWAHPIVYVRGTDGAPYTKYTLIVNRHGNVSFMERYSFTVYDGSVLDAVLTHGYAPWLWLAQFRAGWAVPA